MTTLQDVAREARTGATARTIAARLGASADLVDAMLDELRRHAVVAPVPTTSLCSTSGPGDDPCSAAVRSPSCAGCPLAGETLRPGAGSAAVRVLTSLGVRRTTATMTVGAASASGVASIDQRT